MLPPAIQRFMILFFSIYSFLYILLLLFQALPLQLFIASVQSQWTGFSANGITLHYLNHAYVISEQCTGLVSAIVLIALIFSFQKPALPKKILMAFIGAVALLLINFPRVYLVLLTGKYFGSSASELVHEASWFFMTFFIVGLWLILIQKIANVKKISELV